MHAAAADWPEPGTVVTFGMYNFHLGNPQFIGIGVVAGGPQRHPHADLWRLPIVPLDEDAPPTPAWITLADIIDALPPY